MRRIIYIYRIVCKLLTFAYFGIGISLEIVMLPFVKMFSKTQQDFQRRARKLANPIIRGGIGFTQIVGLVKINISKEDRKKLRTAEGVVVAANHPAFFDSVLMLSLLPWSDIVAKGSLSKSNPLSPLINSLFMTNSFDFGKMMERTRTNLDDGGTILFFAEGTRSFPDGTLRPFKKGAARLSIGTGHPILPVYLGGNLKIGMRKGDKVLQVNPNERFIYDIRVMDEISPEEFAGFPNAIAVRKCTDKLQKTIHEEKERADEANMKNL